MSAIFLHTPPAQAGAALAPPYQPICFSPRPQSASTHANILCLTAAISKNVFFRGELSEGKKKNHIFQRRQRNAKLILPALLERAALHSGVSPGGEWCCCLTKDSCWAESLITGQVPALGPSLRSHSAPAICTKFLSDLFVNTDPNWIKDELCPCCVPPHLIFPWAPLFFFPAPPLSDPPLPLSFHLVRKRDCYRSKIRSNEW